MDTYLKNRVKETTDSYYFDIDKEEGTYVAITFIDGEFEDVDYVFGKTTERQLWVARAYVNSMILELEKEYAKKE